MDGSGGGRVGGGLGKADGGMNESGKDAVCRECVVKEAVGWLRVGWLSVGWLSVGWLRVGWLRVGWLRVVESSSRRVVESPLLKPVMLKTFRLNTFRLNTIRLIPSYTFRLTQSRPLRSQPSHHSLSPPISLHQPRRRKTGFFLLLSLHAAENSTSSARAEAGEAARQVQGQKHFAKPPANLSIASALDFAVMDGGRSSNQQAQIRTVARPTDGKSEANGAFEGAAGGREITFFVGGGSGLEGKRGLLQG